MVRFFTDPAAVSDWRKAQLGEAVRNSIATPTSDGILAVSRSRLVQRSATPLCVPLLLRTLWHVAAPFAGCVFAGIDPDLGEQIEFGLFQKLATNNTAGRP